MRTIEHFFLPPHGMDDSAVFTSFSRAHGCLRDLFLDLSRLLGLTLRPSAPVFRCLQEAFDTPEAALAQEAACVLLLCFFHLVPFELRCA